MINPAKAMYPNLPSASDRPVNEKAAGDKPSWGANPVNDPLWTQPATPTTKEMYRLTSYWLNRRRSK